MVFNIFHRSRYGETEPDYTELVFSQVLSLQEDSIHTFSMKEYINYANEYADIVDFIRDSDLARMDSKKLTELAKKFDKSPYVILVVEEYDDGDKSPFMIKRFHAYAIDSHVGQVDVIGEGVCHFNSQISVLVLATPVLFLFLCSFIIPIVSNFVGLISIPENCMDSMTYMIAPLAFIIGIAMPFLINILPAIIGFDLPAGDVQILKNLHWVIIIVAIFRIAPLIGMVTFCVKANLYTDYLRENWFLIIVTIGGVLGNISWLILGMLMEMSYTGTLL